MNAPQLNVGELDRMTYLGGSDAAAIIGMSDWGTPLTVYKDKIGEGEPLTEEELNFFEDRKELEPIILGRLARRRDVNIVAANHRYVHPKYDFIAAEIDFEFEVTAEVCESCPGIPTSLIGTIQNGEIKTSLPFAAAKFGDEGTDEIPIQYCAQSTHGLMVTGREICLYAVMTGIDQLATYVLHRDQEIIDGLLAKEVNFWHGNVLARIPPEPMDNDDLMILFKKHNGKPVELDDDTMNALNRLYFLRSAQKMAKEEEEEIKFQIGIYIAREWGLMAPEEVTDNALLMYEGQEVSKWRKQRGAHLDQKKLAIDHPKLHAEYMKEHWFRVIPQRKKS